jgi:hypothetical protein
VVLFHTTFQSDMPLDDWAEADRREVDPPLEVESARWFAGATLDWWVRDWREWWGGVRGPDSRQRWVRASDLSTDRRGQITDGIGAGARWRPAAGSPGRRRHCATPWRSGSCTWCRCPAPDRSAGRRRLGRRSPHDWQVRREPGNPRSLRSVTGLPCLPRHTVPLVEPRFRRGAGQQASRSSRSGNVGRRQQASVVMSPFPGIINASTTNCMLTLPVIAVWFPTCWVCMHVTRSRRIASERAA